MVSLFTQTIPENQKIMAQGNRRRPLLVSEIVVGRIAAEARDFADAGRRCFEGMRHGAIPGPVGPGIVCMAFSVELWFKALHCVAYPAGEVPTGHDLLLLFKKLPDAMQAALIHHCGQQPSYFLQALEGDARTFETWRYSYEWAARQPVPTGGEEVMCVNLILVEALPKACEQVYQDFTSAT